MESALGCDLASALGIVWFSMASVSRMTVPIRRVNRGAAELQGKDFDMDPLTRSYYGKEFQLAFLRKKGIEFQNWFVDMMGHAFGEDFDPVRAYGPKGDFKCDGRHVPLGRIHQCYAPDSMRDTETIAKINEDFDGARTHWAQFMKRWCFVHNDTRGRLRYLEVHSAGEAH